MNSIASGNKILMLKVKSGLFLLKLEIHCMTGQKVKFIWNGQNAKPKNSLTGMWNFSCWSEIRRNLISTRTKQMLMPCLRFAFRPFMIYHQCTLFLSHTLYELQKFANEKENYNFIHEKAATNIQLLKCIQFLFDNMWAFVN